MADLIIFGFCVVVVLGASVWFARKEAGAAEAARVSTGPNGKISLSVLDNRLRLGVTGITLLALSAIAGLGGPLLSLLLTAAFVGVRQTLSALFKSHAENSRLGLLMTAINLPEIKNADMAFFFSAIDYAEPKEFMMWKDSIDALERCWFAVLVEPHHFVFFQGADMPPAILVQDASLLGSILSAKTKLVFYANNAQRNRLMVTSNPQAKHIQLLHGDSDKPPSFSPFTKIYDLVFVAGQMAIDRYRDNGVVIPPERFRIVGRPQLSTIRTDANRECDVSAPIVGYMPTWRGYYDDTKFSSLDRAAQVITIIRKTVPGAKIVFKPHPLSYKDLNWPLFRSAIADALGPNGRFADQANEPFDIYNEVDTLITDISSVMIDFLFSGKPLIVVLPDLYTSENAWRYPSLAAAYLVDAKLANLDKVLVAANTDDPMRAKRLEVQKYAFGDYGRPPGEAFAETVQDLLAQGVKVQTTGKVTENE